MHESKEVTICIPRSLNEACLIGSLSLIFGSVLSEMP
jgi:hypothetical protein